jgi:excisionase family DNA binding protein
VTYTVKEVAETTGLNVETVRRSIKNGTIPRARHDGRLLLVPASWLESLDPKSFEDPPAERLSAG